MPETEIPPAMRVDFYCGDFALTIGTPACILLADLAAASTVCLHGDDLEKGETRTVIAERKDAEYRRSRKKAENNEK